MSDPVAVPEIASATQGPIHERSYAGIGARETPTVMLDAMEELARRLASSGWTLRTGFSPGADQAFARGAMQAGGEIELYLPSPGFESQALSLLVGDAPGSRGRGGGAVRVLSRPTAQARQMAMEFHPAWHALDEPARLLRSRDVHEILGEDLEDPVAMVICWTPDGSIDGRGPGAGGTGQALRVADAHAVPVYNLARPEHLAAARRGELGAS